MSEPRDTAPFDVPLAELRERRSSKWTRYAPGVLPLPVAEMDVRLAPPVAQALQRALDLADTGYAGDPGALTAAFSAFAQRRWQWDVNPRDMRTCADVAVGVVEVLRRVIAPGDKVVITPPVYPPFWSWLRSANARAVEVPLRPVASGSRLDLDGIEEAFAAGARTLLLCNPHNPTGHVHPTADLRELADLAVRYEALILSDEIHGPLALAGSTFVPFLSLGPAAQAVGIAFSSASKAWNLAGLKCALIIAGPAHHARVFQKMSREVMYGVGHFGMLAGAAAFEHGEPWLDNVIAALAQNAAYLAELLAEHTPGITFRAPQAGYLAWLDCTRLALQTEPAKVFIERGNVALVPGPDFGTQGAGYARLNYACAPSLLREAVTRMAAALH